MVKQSILFFLLGLALSFVSTINAQLLSISHLTYEDGLSNNLITCIMQDSVGFIWVGTKEGLNRYDGYSFKTYKSYPADSNSILDNIIVSMLSDSRNNLWIGTVNGISRYNREKDNFDRFPTKITLHESFKKEPLGGIAEDANGNIWYGNQNGGVCKLIPSKKQIHYYKYPSKSISEIYVDEKNYIFAGTKDCEIYYYDALTDGFTPADLPNLSHENIPDNYVRKIIEDHDNNILAVTAHGVFEIAPLKGISNKINILPTGMSAFRNNEIRSFFYETPNVVWIGTWGKGLYMYNSHYDKLINFQAHPNKDNSLTNNDINVIYKDRGGVIWIGTQEGLNIIDPGKAIFRKYQHDPDDKKSLHFNFITSFCEDKSGIIWIGTYGGGISKFDPVAETFESIIHEPGKKNGLSNNAVRAISEDKTGRIWIGTMNGLDCYHPEAKRFMNYHLGENDNDHVSSNDILCIINGNDDDLWVGTYGGGLYHITFNKDGSPLFERYLNHPEKRESISSNYIRTLEMDNNDKLWIGSMESGLDRICLKTGEVDNFSVLPESGDPGFNRIKDIHVSGGGFIWLTTWAGLSRFNQNNNSFDFFTVENGLPDNNVSDILQDKYGRIWISTYKGIVKAENIVSENLDFSYYNSGNNLQGSKFNTNASLIDNAGLLYFGGTTGFNIIDPSIIASNEYVPPVVITGLNVFNQPVEINKKVSGRVILDKSITMTKQITLSHKHRTFSIEFAALSFSKRDQNSFKYFLKGVDNQWVEVNSKRRFASYSNLPNGHYTFIVKAANSDGIWNEEGVSLDIKVLPPPWKAWYAFVIYAFVTFCGLLLIRKYTIKNARLKHKLELEVFEKHKTEEVNQLKFRFFTNISHEVRTPLTLIIGPLEKLMIRKQIPPDVLDYLRMMHKNAKRLMTLINQLMDFRKIEMGKLTLEFGEHDIILFLEEIKSTFDGSAKELNIDYTIQFSLDSKMIWFDRNKFEMVVFNLLSNAFKFSNQDGSIHIDVTSSEKSKGKAFLRRMQTKHNFGNAKSLEEGFLIIKISDSGMGIPEDKLEKIFERFYQVNTSFTNFHGLNQTGTGIGLSVARDIIQLHQGEIFVESQYGRGTRFYVLIPLGNSHVPENQLQKVRDVEDSNSTSIEVDILDKSTEYCHLEEVSPDENNATLHLNILIVEDNRDIRTFIKGALSSFYTIHEAENGSLGFKLAIKVLPDLIISDIMMPEMDGHQLCKKIKEDVRTCHIPVIMLTAYNSSLNHIQSYEDGADDYLSKPFNAQLLKIRILNLIENRKKLRELFSSYPSVNPKKITVTNLDSRFLEKAIEIVEERMGDPDFNVVTFGRELCMSRTNLFRKMKALTNLSANEFIRNIKVKHAARLLLEGYNVTQVMDKIGINSRSYFNKCFHEQYNRTPSEYVKDHLYSG